MLNTQNSFNRLLRSTRVRANTRERFYPYATVDEITDRCNSPDTSQISPGTRSRALILCTARLFLRMTLAISGSYSFNASIALSAFRSCAYEMTTGMTPQFAVYVRTMQLPRICIKDNAQLLFLFSFFMMCDQRHCDEWKEGKICLFCLPSKFFEYAFSTPTPYIKEFLFPILSVETSVWILHFCTVCLSVCEWVCLCAGMDDSKSFSLLGPYWSAIVQAKRLSLCDHIARMPDKTCQEYHNCFPFGELEETTRTSSNYMDEDYQARPEV